MVLFLSRADQQNRGLGDITVYMLRDLSLVKTQIRQSRTRTMPRRVCGSHAEQVKTFQPVGCQIDS